MTSDFDSRPSVHDPFGHDEWDDAREDSPDVAKIPVSEEPSSHKEESSWEDDRFIALLTKFADHSGILEYNENIPWFRPNNFHLQRADLYPPDAWFELLTNLGYGKLLHLDLVDRDRLSQVSKVLMLTTSIMKAICKVQSNTSNTPFLPEFHQGPFSRCFSEIVDWIHYIFHTGDHSFSGLIPRWHSKKGQGRRLVAIGSWFDQVLIQCILSYLAPVADNQWLSVWRRNRHNAPIDPPGTYLSYNEHLLFRPWVIEFRMWQRALCQMNRTKEFIIRLDIYNFYNSIDRDRVTRRILGLMNVPILPDVMERYLDFRWYPDGRRFRGVPVGEPISRLLANLYLEPLDRFVLETLRVPYLRYVDDITIGASSREHAQEIMKRIEEFLGERLELTLNYNKCSIHEGSRPSVLAHYILSEYLDKVHNELARKHSEKQLSDSPDHAKLWMMFQGEFPHDLRESLMAHGIDLDQSSEDLERWREKAIRTMKKFSAYRLAKYFEEERILPYLNELLTNGDVESLRTAILCLARFKRLSFVHVLSNILSNRFINDHPELGITLLKTLSKKSRGLSYDDLDRVYQSPSPLIRSTACLLANSLDIPAQGLLDPDPVVRRTALSRLSTEKVGAAVYRSKTASSGGCYPFGHGFESTLLAYRFRGTPLLPPDLTAQELANMPFKTYKVAQSDKPAPTPPPPQSSPANESEDDNEIPF